LVPLIWGTTYVVTSELLPPDRPLLAAALRSLPAGMVLVATTGALPSGAWWWRTAALGALNIALFFPLLFLAAYRLPGGVAATAAAVQPLFVVLMGRLAADERPSAGQVATAFGGLAGVALVVLDRGARLDAVGVAAALLGALAMATGSVLVQRWGTPASAAGLAGWQLTAGGLLLAPLALALEGLPPQLDARNLGGYAYLSFVGGVLAYTLWFRGIAAVGARRATALALLSPVVAATIDFALGRPLGPRQLAGAMLVLACVLAAQGSGRPAAERRRRRPVLGSC
jgi:probable blue pigment (indigoidine) exporter